MPPSFSVTLEIQLKCHFGDELVNSMLAQNKKKEEGRGVNLRIKGPFSVGLLISEMFILPIKDVNLCTKHFSILNLSSPER